VRDGSARCDAHKVKAWSKYADAPQRVTGHKLRRLRDELFSREPLCRPCSSNGHTTLATIRDHIVPLAEGGTDDPANIQPICETCHEIKSKAERLRGRGLVAPAPKGRGGVILGAAPAAPDRLGGFLRAQVIEGGGVNSGRPEHPAALAGAVA
jgi:5-methylcytosine-specific restriction protein A